MALNIILIIRVSRLLGFKNRHYIIAGNSVRVPPGGVQKSFFGGGEGEGSSSTGSL